MRASGLFLKAARPALARAQGGDGLVPHEGVAHRALELGAVTRARIEPLAGAERRRRAGGGLLDAREHRHRARALPTEAVQMRSLTRRKLAPVRRDADVDLARRHPPLRLPHS